MGTDEKKFLGVYRAIVRDNNDPEQLKRVRCQVPEVLGVELLTDWAGPSTDPAGGLEEVDGGSGVPSVGATLMVEFESGDVNRPVYRGAWWGRPKGKNHVPKLARGQRDESALPPKGTDQFASAAGGVRLQPQSPYAAKYPFNRVMKTKNGKTVIEIDDTPGAERLHVFHGPSKSWFEMDVMGKLSIRAAGGEYKEVLISEDEHVKGDRHAQVDGNDALLILGNKFETIYGSRTTVVFGNDQELVLGTKITNVLGFYSRLAGVQISDFAPIVSHNP